MSSGCPGLPDIDGADAACTRRRCRTADFAMATQNIGVQDRETYVIKRMDEDFFEET
jgi:hypothetical protein